MVVGAAAYPVGGVGDGALSLRDVVAGYSEASGVPFAVFPTHDAVDVVVAEGLVKFGEVGGAPAAPFGIAVVKGAGSGDVGKCLLPLIRVSMFTKKWI